MRDGKKLDLFMDAYSKKWMILLMNMNLTILQIHYLMSGRI